MNAGERQLKPNWQLFRKLALAIEETGKPGLPQIPGYTEDEIGYHAYLLVSARLADGYSVRNMGHRNEFFFINDLRMLGHEFAELARDETAFNEALAEAQRHGGVTLDVLRALLSRPRPGGQGNPNSVPSQDDALHVVTQRALLFSVQGKNGSIAQNLLIGPGGPHHLPGWVRHTETFKVALHAGVLRIAPPKVSAEASAQAAAPSSADPGALSPGREYPRFMYHATEQPRMVTGREEEAQLGREWSRVYIYQEYPKVKYHWNGNSRNVKDSHEEAALGNGWANNPGAFTPYEGTRPAREEAQDPVKWLDDWFVPGLTSDHKKKIRAVVLRADATFDRSPDPDAGALTAMREVFDGIARILFDAAIVTEDILRKDLAEFVWDSAIAGAWWRLASESRQDIFPEPIGHYWIWREDNPAALGLFRAETRLWRAELLDTPVPVLGPAVRLDEKIPNPQEAMRNEPRFVAVPAQAKKPDANSCETQTVSLVDLLMKILAAKNITVETWARDNAFGRSSVFDWKAAHAAGLPPRGKVSPEKCEAIEEAIRTEAKELGLIPE